MERIFGSAASGHKRSEPGKHSEQSIHGFGATCRFISLSPLRARRALLAFVAGTRVPMFAAIQRSIAGGK